MNNKIVIVHQSEIIQKGLMIVLSQYNTDDFITLKTCDELANYKPLKGTDIFFVIDEQFIDQFQSQYLHLFTQSKAHVKVFTITAKATKKPNFISLYDSSVTIIDKISKTDDVPKPKSDNFSGLSDREKDVLKLVALGYQNKEIAEKLFISIHTVISHRKNITDKLGIKSISGLTVYAIINKLIDTDNIDPSTLI